MSLRCREAPKVYRKSLANFKAAPQLRSATMSEYFETSSRIGRGMAKRSLDLIEAMRQIAEAMQPITGRGVGYKLFAQYLIASMSKSEMAKVYRLLLIAREQGIIPWAWIVEEGRILERVPQWTDPAEYAECVARSYRRDFWTQQPIGSRSGLKRGRYAAYSSRCSFTTVSIFNRSVDLAAVPKRTTLPRMTMADR